ncbi:MAG: HAD family hydrolase [Deltaproteobacteria bacterium]|nr:MAG: HAD family hydrolase [Deltaproteobacteria bacterium]
MKPFDQFPKSEKKHIQFVLTDIDDTLTIDGRLPAIALTALERLAAAGITVIPITGRPAGWCDHIARMWPVEAVVGENGAFYFRYDANRKKMVRSYWHPPARRAEDRKKLDVLKKTIPEQVPGCQVSADQAYRETDLAIDFSEDVDPLTGPAIDQIVDLFHQAGAQAKVSSIHVNGWFGEYNKLAMTRRLFKEHFQVPPDRISASAIYVGDSPNDEPMFAAFSHGVGVANICHFADRMTHRPAWITKNRGGYGFAEMVDVLTGSDSAPDGK